MDPTRIDVLNMRKNKFSLKMGREDRRRGKRFRSGLRQLFLPVLLDALESSVGAENSFFVTDVGDFNQVLVGVFVSHE